MCQNARKYVLCIRFLIVLFTTAFLNSNSFAQEKVIVTGKVVESGNKAAMAGVSILVKGSSKGTVTDAEGNFSIAAPVGSRLIFSYLNYTTFEQTVKQAGFMNVTLASNSKDLNEVVVIGYGERKKKDVTGAISVVTSRDIEKSTAMSPEIALQGTAAGVVVQSGGGDPNSRPVIRIRGVNTFGYADPLYVVDGVPIYEGGAGQNGGSIGDIRSPVNIFTLINPDDIESMTVLKDASSAAIYGVRASNGVILITTRRGKSGKPRVEISSSTGIQNIARKIPVLNTSQYFGLVTEAYNNNPSLDPVTGLPQTISQSINLGPIYDPSAPEYLGNNPTYDWVDAVLNKNAAMQDHSVRVSGGNDNTNYFFSAGYSRIESPLKANNMNRYSIAYNVDSRVSKFVKVGMTMRMNKESSLVNSQTDLSTMAVTIPFQPIYDKNDATGFAPVVSGTFAANPDYDPSLLSPGVPFNFATGPTKLYGPGTRFNALAYEALNNTGYDLYNALGNAYVQIEPVSGLQIKGTLGGQYYSNLRTSWLGFDAWRFNQTPSNPYAGQDGSSKGTYGQRQGTTSNLNKELTVHYNHTFNGEHNIDVTLSASDEFARWSWTDLSGQVGSADPQYRSIGNNPPYTMGSSSILQEDALIGYLARVSYKFQDKYYLDGTLRYDGSSRLAPGHNWSEFPSFAAAWRISSEKFFPKISFLNDLKLRGGWGELGNFQSAGYYEYLSSVLPTPDYAVGSGNGDPYGTQLQGIALPNFANTTLTWEKVRTTNIGFDAMLFDNRVSFSAEYYNKVTFGIIQSVLLPPNTGIQDPADLNVATVRNQGIELQLGYNQKFGNVDFNVSGNFSTVNNKVLKLNEGTPIGGETGRVEEGYPIDYLWGYKTAGIFQNQAEINTWRQSHADLTLGQSLTDPSLGYKYQPGDMYFQDLYGNPPAGGKAQHSNTPDSSVSPSDRTYLGKTIPGFSYGLSLSASYKGIDISMLFQGVGNVQGINTLREGLEGMGGVANQDTKTLQRWTSSNPSMTMPRAVFGDPANTLRYSDRFVEDAGYMRLKNLTLGYSLPKTFLTQLKFVQNFRVYVTAINLFTVTKWTGYDPEADLTGNGNNMVPTTRQFLFGVKATF